MGWAGFARPGTGRVLRGLRIAWRARRGGLAMVTALALPPLVLVAVGAVELQGVASDQAATQNVADQAALWGAQQLGVAPVGVEARTQSWAAPQLQAVLSRADVKVSASVQSGGLMRVAIDTHRPSFFMNLMPAGGFRTHAEATAQSINRLPLCVLTFGASTSNQARLAPGSLVKAPACMVHARGDIQVDGQAVLTAGAVETESSKAQGTITPAAGTDAAPIPDPFAQLAIAFPQPCGPSAEVQVGPATPKTYAPPAGQSWLVISDHITFTANVGPLPSLGGGVLTFKPGEYYLCQDIEAAGGPLSQAQQNLLGPASKHGPGSIGALGGPLLGAVQGLGGQLASDAASIVGDDVVLIFADGRQLKLSSGSSLTLNGRKSGPLAGFVMVAGLGTSGGAFSLNADQVQSLLGTVYVRNTPLELTGSLQMAAASAWTVIVANSLLLDKSSPGVLINANYASSTVPRPTGVGDSASSSNARLVR